MYAAKSPDTAARFADEIKIRDPKPNAWGPEQDEGARRQRIPDLMREAWSIGTCGGPQTYLEVLFVDKVRNYEVLLKITN